MDNSESFSIDTSLLTRSFFSSFSSQVSSTTWKPLLNSVQENQRLSRLIQVREGKLQELKANPQSNQNILSSSLSDLAISDLNKPRNLEKLDAIIYSSQKNLKIFSIKLGKLPKNLVKALDTLQVRPERLSVVEKLEYLSAIEILREKLTDFTADSEEMLGYFKDIILESESNGVDLDGDKEKFLKFVDKRVEIFQSGDPTRTKIQESYHLIMNLEQWKGQKNQNLMGNNEKSLLHQGFEKQLKQLIGEVNRKNEEIERLKEKNRKMGRKVLEISKNLAGEVRKLKYCTEFELFNTWNSLIGGEGSSEISLNVIFNKISEQQRRKSQNSRIAMRKIQEIKQDYGITREFVMEMLGNMEKIMEACKGNIGKAVAASQSKVRSLKNELGMLKNTTSSELQKINDYICDIGQNKMDLSRNIQSLKQKVLYVRSENNLCTAEISETLSTHGKNLKNCQNKIKERANNIKKHAESLKKQSISFRTSVESELQGFKSEAREIFLLIHQKTKRKAQDLKDIHTANKESICTSLENFKGFMLNDVKKSLKGRLNVLKVELIRTKTLFQEEKTHAKQELAGFQVLFQVEFAHLLEKLTENHIVSKEESILASKEKAKLMGELEKTKSKIDAFSDVKQKVTFLKRSQESLKSLIKANHCEFKANIDSLNSNCKELKSKSEQLAKNLFETEKAKFEIEKELNICKKLLVDREKVSVSHSFCQNLKLELLQLKTEMVHKKESIFAYFASQIALLPGFNMDLEMKALYLQDLEADKAALELENSELKKENMYFSSDLSKNAQDKREILNNQALQKNKFNNKLKKVLRKVRAHKSVLMKEKEVLKGFLFSLRDFVNTEIIRNFEEKYSNDIRFSGQEKISTMLSQKSEKMKKLVKHAKEQEKVALNNAKIKFNNEIMEMQNFCKQSMLHLSSIYLEELSKSNAELQKSEEKYARMHTTYKTALQKTFALLRDQNTEFRSCFTRMMKVVMSEKNTIKGEVTKTIKNDLEGMKTSIKSIQNDYKTENHWIQAENASLQRLINVRSQLILPIEQILQENYTHLSDLRISTLHNYELNSRNLEENIKRLENFSEKIEDLQNEGYDIINKYKQDSICPETPEKITETLEISDFYEENSLETSIFSNPDDEENKLCIKNNPLLKKYLAKNKKLMRVPTLIKNIESILDDKFRNDNDALQKNRDPLSMTEYLLASVKNQHNLMADKKINEILHTFQESIGEPRIKFYCRLFQVFDLSPIPYKLSLYLIKMRYYFNIFVNTQVIPEFLDKKSDKMQITEIIKRVRSLFNADVATGEVVLKQMMPINLVPSIWTRTCIQYYIFINGISPDKCFLSITTENHLTENMFVHGLSKVHNTFVCENDLHQLFSENSAGTMTVNDFEKLFALKSYFDIHQKHMVDQLQFLNALIEGYSSMRIRHYKELQGLISEKVGKKEKISKEETNSILAELDPAAKAEKIFENPDEVSMRDLRKKVFELNIGGKGIGCFNLKSIEKVYDGKSIDEEEKVNIINT